MSTTAHMIQRVAGDLLAAFEAGTLPQALSQIFIRRKVEVPSRLWTWTNRAIGIVRGHVYAAGFRQWEELGRRVTRGQRAFYILAPKTKKVSAEEGEEERVTVQAPAEIAAEVPA